METLGETEVRVRAFGRVKCLLVSVVKEQDKPLFGLDWCISFNLSMPKVVHLIKGAVPKLYSARLIPFPMKKAVEDELNRLVKQDILETVDTTKNPIEWASPLVCAPKSSGVRICVDFKVTINQHVYVDP